ncbi:MAG: hypothetical protein PWR21_90 [Methanoculleus sp.]|nr:hypothetical protein [Methanoculleus sp.]
MLHGGTGEEPFRPSCSPGPSYSGISTRSGCVKRYVCPRFRPPEGGAGRSAPPPGLPARGRCGVCAPCERAGIMGCCLCRVELESGFSSTATIEHGFPVGRATCTFSTQIIVHVDFYYSYSLHFSRTNSTRLSSGYRHGGGDRGGGSPPSPETPRRTSFFSSSCPTASRSPPDAIFPRSTVLGL